jgi:hypothetical protein
MICNCDNLTTLDRNAVYNGRFTEFEITQQCVACNKIWVWGNVW